MLHLNNKFILAQKEYYKALKINHFNSRLNYNIALNSYALKSKTLSLYFIKEAIKLDPFNDKYKKFLLYIENDNDIYLKNYVIYLLYIFEFLLLFISCVSFFIFSITNKSKKSFIIFLLLFILFNNYIKKNIQQKTNVFVVKKNALLKKAPDKSKNILKANSPFFCKNKI